MSHHRRTVRHPCRLAVRLMDGGRPQPALTYDVSEHGLFVRTDETWVPNALVRLHILDPDDARPLALLGIVARCIPVGTDGEHPEGPGIGVSLFGNPRPVEVRWRGLVRAVAAAASGWRESIDAGPDAIDAVRRRHTRRHALLEVEVEADGARHPADLVDVSEGGVLLTLETAIETETSARVHFGARGGDAVDVHALVVRSAGPKAMGLKITPLSAAETQRWTSFIGRHAPVRRALPAFLPGLNPEERP